MLLCKYGSRFVAMLIFLDYSHLVNKAVEFNVGQCLCKAIGNHLISWYVRKYDSLCSYFITNVVVLNIDMFCTKVENRVLGALLISSYHFLVG